MDKYIVVPVLKLGEASGVPDDLDVLESTNRSIEFRSRRDEQLVGFEYDADERIVCDGLFLGEFTWGSSRVSVWFFNKGIHRCFTYRGYMETICGGNLLLTPSLNVFDEHLRSDICRLIKYIDEIIGAPSIIVESRDDIQSYNNIIVCEKISIECISGYLERVLMDKIGDRRVVDKLVRIFYHGVITPSTASRILESGKITVSDNSIEILLNDKIVLKYPDQGGSSVQIH